MGSKRGVGATEGSLAVRLARALGERTAAARFAVEEARAVPGVRVAVCLRADAAGGWSELDREPREEPAPDVAALAERALADGGLVVSRTEQLDRPERGGAAALPLGPTAPATVLVVGLDAGLDPEGPAAAELREIASVTAGLLENEHRLALSKVEARRDPLTGLPNRRAFEEHLARLAGGSFSLIFCDLDDFKRINDVHGYDAGDSALAEVARTLASELRPGEGVFRVGGDEFCVVVLAGAAAAAAVATRLREAIARRSRGPTLTTLSTGIATSEQGRSARELLARAALDLGQSRRDERAGLRAAQHDLSRLRILVVDDDPALRLLLRTTFELVHVAVDEAATADEARTIIHRSAPDAVVLDVALPGTDGRELVRELRSDPRTSSLGVVLLTGGDLDLAAARDAGADALVHKPFSPLDLLDKVERLAGGASHGRPLAAVGAVPAEDQLLLYAGDLRRLLEIERRQRDALERAYRETLGALASALETRDVATGAHSLRVQRYASEIARAFAPELLDDPSVEYGFLLHDIGKIGIPDRILRKPAPLTKAEWQIMQTHAALGAQVLADVGLLRGEGLSVVRHHHERWDGRGYPDGLAGEKIPLGARIFALADTLDAVTTDRPYRRARAWRSALAIVRDEAGKQFDPSIAAAFDEVEPRLRLIQRKLAAA